MVYERFTDQARRAVILAQEEAQLLHHDLIDTEHVLLGLIREGEGMAATALETIGISLQAARDQVRNEVGPVTTRSPGTPRFSPPAKRALDLARQAASELEQNFIGTEHLLLGILRDENSVAARVVEHLGKELSTIRDEVLDLVDAGHESRSERREDEEKPANPDDEGNEQAHRHLIRRLLPILAVGVVLAGGTVIARRRGYLIGRNLIVRCRQGHLFTTIWLPGASLKSIRLGWARIQRCPVGKHWSVVTPVREADLSKAELRRANEIRDIRIP